MLVEVTSEKILMFAQFLCSLEVLQSPSLTDIFTCRYIVKEWQLESFMPECRNFLLLNNQDMFHSLFGSLTCSCFSDLLCLNGCVLLYL